MDIKTLNEKTLMGLSSLRELRLDNVRLMHLPDFLHGVAKKLDRLEVTGALTIDKLDLLSGVTLPALSDIRLRLNSRNVVGPTVFKGAVLLSVVDMQNCRIELISPRVFYPFRKTLMYINLVGNRLKTVSAAMFDYLLPSVHLRIYLFDNLWNCECELVDMKDILETHSDNFPGPIVCTSPLIMMGRPIKTTPFCMSTADPPEIENVEMERCSNETGTVFSRSGQSMRSKVYVNVANGNASFLLDPQDDSNSTRITISQQMDPEIRVINNDCICNSSKSSKRFIPLNQFNSSQVYLFCLQKSEQSNPKCLSYFIPKPKHTKSVWLTNSVKSTFLVGLVVAMLIVMTLSFLIGTIIFQRATDVRAPALSKSSISVNDMSNR